MDTFGAALAAANDTYNLYHTHENSDTEGELLPSSSDSEEFFLPTSKKRKISEASAEHIQFTRSPIPSPRISPTSPPTSQSATRSSPSGFGSDGSHTEGDSLLPSSPSRHASPGISDDDPDDSATHIPTCSICLQPYTQRAYIHPCFHSFCFICIVQWTELSGGLCPMCKRYSEFLVYDADVNLGTFKRWHLQRTDAKASDRNGGRSDFVNGSRSSSSPNSLSSSSKSKVSSATDGKPLELLARRRAVYTRSLYPTAAYPVSPFIANATYLTPTQLARTIPFIRRDLKAILEDDYELLIEEHVVSVLMQEHETKGKKTREQVVEMLRSWLEINGDGSKGVASRFVEEVTAFAKSGMDVGKWDRVVKYRSMDEK